MWEKRGTEGGKRRQADEVTAEGSTEGFRDNLSQEKEESTRMRHPRTWNIRGHWWLLTQPITDTPTA